MSNWIKFLAWQCWLNSSLEFFSPAPLWQQRRVREEEWWRLGDMIELWEVGRIYLDLHHKLQKKTLIENNPCWHELWCLKLCLLILEIVSIHPSLTSWELPWVCWVLEELFNLNLDVIWSLNWALNWLRLQVLSHKNTNYLVSSDTLTETMD